MTNYYYLASDQKLGLGNASLEFIETEPWMIPGFDYPVQIEILNGAVKEWELRELLQYIRNYTAPYEVCTIQVANLLNSDRVKRSVQKKFHLLLNDLVDPKQLVLEEGHMLTISKVPSSR